MLDEDFTGSETVLVVEDEQSVLNLCRQMLTHGGYRVLTARNGNEALTVYEQRSAEIDLVITDVVMPGLNGKDLSAQLTLRRPELPILFASGYDFNFLEETLLSGEITRVIRKPYKTNELLKRVRELLDEAKAGRASCAHG
jgi:CheY-like chemotaxis protein